jgi:hypothetical protein
VACAVNGADALERIAAEKFDLLLAHRETPIIDGGRLVLALRSAGLQIPVVMLSGGALCPTRLLGSSSRCWESQFVFLRFSRPLPPRSNRSSARPECPMQKPGQISKLITFLRAMVALIAFGTAALVESEDRRHARIAYRPTA